MIDLSDIFDRRAIAAGLRCSGPKQALRALCDLASAAYGVNARAASEAVQARTRLRSPGIGDGVALPDAELAHLTRVCGVFAQLKTPIDFEAQDGAPADLVALIFTHDLNGSAHLKTMARLARGFRDERLRAQLRACASVEGLYRALTQDATSNAA